MSTIVPQMNCTYFPSCRACDYWSISYERQKALKAENLKQLMNLSSEFMSAVNFEFISTGEHSLRHRFDFTFETLSENEQIQSMGFYTETRQVLDIKTCLQLSPELQKVYSEFRQHQISTKDSLIKKGSVRLRISPTGQKGCWLDFANTDIKNLLDDSRYLNQLLEAGFIVEIGQKGKILKKNSDGLLKLSDPEPKEWFQTQAANGTSLSLACLISDFTQPSWSSAKKIAELILKHTASDSIKDIIEFGPGVGQYTLPLLSQNKKVRVFENNPKALQVLKANAETHSFDKNLTVYAGDFQKSTSVAKLQDSKNSISTNLNTKLSLASCDLALVNPPRSGLMHFAEALIQMEVPQCIYISCYPESMAVDLIKFQSSGYQIKKLAIVDQFPQTRHYECFCLIEKK